MANNNDFIARLKVIIDQMSINDAQKELLKKELNVKAKVNVEGKEASLKSINALANAMASFRDNNTKMTKEMKSRLNDMYKSLTNGANLSQAEVNELRNRFSVGTAKQDLPGRSKVFGL